MMIDYIPPRIANSISQYVENWSWVGKLAAIFTTKIVDLWNFREQIFNPRQVMEDISIKKDDYITRKELCEESLSVEHLKFVNYVWLTPRNNPKSIPSKYVESVKQHMELFKDWKFRIWTNMDFNAFMDVNIPFASLGLEVLNLDHLKTQHRSALIDRISAFDNYKKHGGLYVDTTKYLTLENKGGIFIDLNFVFSRVYQTLKSAFLIFWQMHLQPCQSKIISCLQNPIILLSPLHSTLLPTPFFIRNAL